MTAASSFVRNDSILSDSHATCGGRLTAVQGDPVQDRLGAYAYSALLYFTPYKGNRIGLFDGNAWRIKKFSELSIKLTDAQNGNVISGSPNVSGLRDTSQLVIGMNVTGTSIPANTVISSIPTATDLVLNNNATGTGKRTLTFAVPADTIVDIYIYLSSGSPKLRFGPLWANNYMRATNDDVSWYDGVLVNYNTATLALSPTWGRYLGTIRTNPTAGYVHNTYDVPGNYMRRHIWNYYNQEWYPLSTYNTNASWSCTSDTEREYNAGSGQIRGNMVFGISQPRQFFAGSQQYAYAATEGYWYALYFRIRDALDSVGQSLWDSHGQCNDVTSTYAPLYRFEDAYGHTFLRLTQGYSYITQTEVVDTGDTFTVYGSGYSSTVTFLC